MKKVGFIGLGIMGKQMAKNLLKAGYQLVAYDIVREYVEDFVVLGAIAASSCKDVAEQCPIIITMLPNSPHVKTAVLDEDGVLCGAKSGTLLIDMSSIDPLASKEISMECAKKGVRMLDAPVSGGEPKAKDGTLSIMVGGNESDLLEVRELLLCMGSSVVYCGKIGAGNITKLANQIIVAVNIAAVAEAITLAQKLGVQPEIVYQAIRGGLAGSTVLDAKAPMMIAGNFMPGFKVDLHIKDLKNALKTATSVVSPHPLTALVLDMFNELHEDGYGIEDHSALAKYYNKHSGV